MAKDVVAVDHLQNPTFPDRIYIAGTFFVPSRVSWHALYALYPKMALPSHLSPGGVRLKPLARFPVDQRCRAARSTWSGPLLTTSASPCSSPPGRCQRSVETVLDIEVQFIDDGPQLIPLQLFQNVTLRRHGPPNSPASPDRNQGAFSGVLMIADEGAGPKPEGRHKTCPYKFQGFRWPLPRPGHSEPIQSPYGYRDPHRVPACREA
jgi:hypothetical protein